MEGTGEGIENWEVDDMMNDGDKNGDGLIDYEGELNVQMHCLIMDAMFLIISHVSTFCVPVFVIKLTPGDKGSEL